MGTGTVDRKLVQQAIGKLYAASGHDWPSFVWYESPRELLTFAKSLGRFGLVPLRESLMQPLRLEANEVETRKCFRPMLWGVASAPFEGLLDQQPGLVMETLSPPLRRLMVRCLNEMCIGLELDWISYHDFCDRHLGVKYQSRRLERIRLWSEIAKSCYWWAPYEATCFVSDRPAEIHLDVRERLHSLREPAMAFSDGWSLYAIHGSFVSERLVMHPNEAGLEDLPLDENLEVLHATIEILGHERFLAAAKAQLSSSFRHKLRPADASRSTFFPCNRAAILTLAGYVQAFSGHGGHHHGSPALAACLAAAPKSVKTSLRSTFKSSSLRSDQKAVWTANQNLAQAILAPPTTPQPP